MQNLQASDIQKVGRKMASPEKKKGLILTCHSCTPCKLSGLSFLTATATPAPLRAGLMVVSSTQPLYTRPNPPSPSTVSDLKFLVAAFSSANVKTRRLAAFRILPSELATPPPFDAPELSGRLLVVLGALCGDFPGIPGLTTAWALGAAMTRLAIAPTRMNCARSLSEPESVPD
jgi:hypothetical protein